jgi:hypothetical protein
MPTPPVPRELQTVLVEVDERGIVATFDLGTELPIEGVAEWFTYGISVAGPGAGLTKHFAVRFSPRETKAFIFDFDSATQANYDASHVEDLGRSVIVRFPDSSIGADAITSSAGFSTLEGKDVRTDAPVQILAS